MCGSAADPGVGRQENRMSIRKALHKDVAAIEALLRSVPGVWQASWHSGVVERALASAEGLALVAEENDTIIGFVCAHDNGFRAYLSELIVIGPWQHHGLGSALLAALEEDLAQRGCQLLVADIYPPATPFYRALGWRESRATLLCHDITNVTSA
jgi:predicted N-acetyltransferase YhbS